MVPVQHFKLPTNGPAALGDINSCPNYKISCQISVYKSTEGIHEREPQRGQLLPHIDTHAHNPRGHHLGHRS